MSEQELLQEFIELFPVEGHVVGYVELKYRLAGKYGADTLDEMLEKLIDKGYLSKFEFNNTVNYKAQKEMPVSLDGGGGVRSSAPATPTPSGVSQTGGNGNQIKALGDLVVAIAETIDDENVKSQLEAYKKKFE